MRKFLECREWTSVLVFFVLWKMILPLRFLVLPEFMFLLKEATLRKREPKWADGIDGGRRASLRKGERNPILFSAKDFQFCFDKFASSSNRWWCFAIAMCAHDAVVVKFSPDILYIEAALRQSILSIYIICISMCICSTGHCERDYKRTRKRNKEQKIIV